MQLLQIANIEYALNRLFSGNPLNDYDRDFFHKRWKPF